jgi:hypothetical protein
MCFGIAASTTSVCSSRGACVGPDTCECFNIPKLQGPNCELNTHEFIWFVVGLVLAFVCVLVVITIPGIFCCHRVYRYRTAVLQQNKVEQDMKDLLKESLIRADTLSKQVDRDWIIPLSDIKLDERISEGAYVLCLLYLIFIGLVLL